MNPQAFAKKKNTWFKMEDFHTATMYALTINPHDCFQSYDLNSINRFHTFKRRMTIFLRDTIKPFCSQYNFYIELSTNGLLHLHGWIVVDSIVDFYLSAIPRINNMSASYLTDVKDILITHDSPYESWNAYCLKQQTMLFPLNGEIKHTDIPNGIEDMADEDYSDLVSHHIDKLKTQALRAKKQKKPPKKQTRKSRLNVD